MTETLFNESGQLPDSSGVIYTCPADTQTIVSLITYVNSGAGPNNVNLYFRPSGGTDRSIMEQDLALATLDLKEIRGPITMLEGDTLEADATNPSEVDFAIFGVQIT